MTEVVAKLKDCRMSAQKARLIVDQIRLKSADEALSWLQFCPKKAARIIRAVLKSAVANAEENHGYDIDTLTISTATVDEGRRLKRMRPRAKGRGARIIKPSCHITIKVTSS